MNSMQSNWHTQKISEVLATFDSTEYGLRTEEAKRRLVEYGRNRLPEAVVDHLPIIFLRQFQSPLIYLLVAASAAIFFMGEGVDAGVILAVLFFNAIVGTIQEGRAQNTLLALKRFVETTATIMRNGSEVIVADDEIVPGDIILLQEGEKIPADARVILSNNLTIDESALTGESEPVHKTTDPLDGTAMSALEKKNMILKGTHVVAGNGKAVVVATGLSTTIGKVTKAIAAIDSEIPLKTNIRALSKLVIITVVSICLALFFLGLGLGKSAKEMFTTVITLSVSIIPEGLPIVMTLILASGVWRMSKRNALIKRLQAVEALGQARVIAVDKTGTLTKNEMTIQKVFVDGKIFEIGGTGYEPKGEVRFEGKTVNAVDHPELLLAGKIATRTANARVFFSEEANQWRIGGDPTEAALLVFAQKIGFRKDEMLRETPLISELPFDFIKKYHATLHQTKERKTLSVIGAPEIILGLCQKVWHNGKHLELSAPERAKIENEFFMLSAAGLRVIACAESHTASDVFDLESKKDLVFVGFFGMKDALRPEVHEAMARATSAGIRVVMITGDHKITAMAIGREAGIFHEGDRVITGEEIESMSDVALSAQLGSTTVFARVTPEHKMRIVEAYKSRGEIVAMTGDGVNDAPSLVAADLGVAMGTTGTEVAKEAADIILLDDNFGSIVSAIEEGRSIYKTIKKVILYLFSTSFGEVFTIAGALLLGFPLPLLPAQIIWLNFVTDGFLDVALAMEPKEKGLLQENFERPRKYLVDALMGRRILLMAIPMMIGTLFLFRNYYAIDLTKAWTISLTTLAVFQWFNAWNCRSEDQSIFRTNPFSNKFLVAATVTVMSLQFLVVYHPFMQKLFRTTDLSLTEWLTIIPLAASIIIVEEIRKWRSRKKNSIPRTIVPTT